METERPIQFRCRPVCRIAGFTLLEVLLAMSLLGMMMVLLFSVLAVGSESWTKGEHKLVAVNEKAVVYQFFRRYLSTIQPIKQPTDDKKQQLSFIGETQRLQFVSMLPVSSGRYGFQTFTIEPDRREAEQLLVNIVPFYPAIDGRDWKPEEVVLLSGMSDFQINYFGYAEGSDQTLWMERWESQSNLPLLIKIKIVLQDDSDWPEMVFAIPQVQTLAVADQSKRP